MRHESRNRKRRRVRAHALINDGLDWCSLYLVYRAAEAMGYLVNKPHSRIEKGGDRWNITLRLMSPIFKQSFSLYAVAKPRALKGALRRIAASGEKDLTEEASRLLARIVIPQLFPEQAALAHLDTMLDPYPAKQDSRTLAKWLHGLPPRLRAFVQDFVDEFGATIRFREDLVVAHGVCCLLADEWRSMAVLRDDPESQLARIRQYLNDNHPGSALMLYSRYKPDDEEQSKKEGDVALDYILEHLTEMEASGRLERLDADPLARFALYREGALMGKYPLYVVPITGDEKAKEELFSDDAAKKLEQLMKAVGLPPEVLTEGFSHSMSAFLERRS